MRKESVASLCKEDRSFLWSDLIIAIRQPLPTCCTQRLRLRPCLHRRMPIKNIVARAASAYYLSLPRLTIRSHSWLARLLGRVRPHPQLSFSHTCLMCLRKVRRPVALHSRSSSLPLPSSRWCHTRCISLQRFSASSPAKCTPRSWQCIALPSPAVSI